MLKLLSSDSNNQTVVIFIDAIILALPNKNLNSGILYTIH